MKSGHGRRFFAAHRSPIAGQRGVVAPLRPGLFYRAGDGRFSCRQGERGRIDRVLPCQVPAGERWTDDDFQCRGRGAPTTGNRDYRWSSTPDVDRRAVFGTRLGQRPSEPRDLADRLRPAAIILQLPDTRRA
jgi:hypothetical protein